MNSPDKEIVRSALGMDRVRRRFLRAGTAGAALLSLPALPGLAAGQRGKDGFTLWQLPPQTGTQMNCYVLRTRNGQVIVIDGGNAGDAPYLKGFLGALGNHVHHWFISHPHSDHLDAVTAILRDPHPPKVEVFHGSFPERDWIARYEPGEEKTLEAFHETLGKTGIGFREHTLGETLEADGVRFEILGIKSPEITPNPVNNSSVLMRVSGGGRVILFTGDLGVEGGEKALKSKFREKLRAEYVQMAHHGQNGVGEDFYRAVKPSCCLWPTPDWLWDNNNGGGKGSGPWATLTVRGWMEKLGVKRHYVSKDGLFRIE